MLELMSRLRNLIEGGSTRMLRKNAELEIYPTNAVRARNQS